MSRLSTYAVPMDLWALASVVLDDDVALPRRVAALRRIERAPKAHHGELARLIVSALHGPPDFATQVHLALLVLDRNLAVGRGADGRFIASAQPIAEAHDDGVGLAMALPDVGRVVGLDALALLFDDSEPVPAFLTPAERGAPAPYRPSARVLAERAAEEARRKRYERMRELGLDPDDLDDDAPPPRVAWIERLRAPIVATVDAGASESARRMVVDGAVLGVVHPGAWWSDERAGDHRQARRWLFRLERAPPNVSDAAAEEAAPTVTMLRRERPFTVRKNMVTVRLGVVRFEKRVDGRNAVAFVEEEHGLIVGVTIAWSSPRPSRGRP